MRTVLLFATAFVLTGCSAPQERVPEVRPFVDVTWLNENLEAVIPLDVRQDRPGVAFADAHIPGAAHTPYGQDPWRVTRDGVPAVMPQIQDLELLIGALGISNDDYVVVVSQGESAVEFGAATRIYWQFKVLGHERIAVLDGGFNAWLAAGYPTEKGVNRRPRATYTADLQPHLVATKEDVLAALDTGIPLIDARSANYYRGEAKARIAARYGRESRLRSRFHRCRGAMERGRDSARGRADNVLQHRPPGFTGMVYGVRGAGQQTGQALRRLGSGVVRRSRATDGKHRGLGSVVTSGRRAPMPNPGN
jgi:rhodanese-related sulfurtransferase